MLGPNLKVDLETLDGDIGLQCLSTVTLRSMCRGAGVSDKGSTKQMIARLRKFYQTPDNGR